MSPLYNSKQNVILPLLPLNEMICSQKMSNVVLDHKFRRSFFPINFVLPTSWDQSLVSVSFTLCSRRLIVRFREPLALDNYNLI